MPNLDILRCDTCNKPFDKPSTLKRHGYYCRSRQAGYLVRSRSCLPCARRKTRCDNQQPKCSTCNEKAIECVYPVDKRRSARPKHHDHDSASVTWQESTPSVEFYQEALTNDAGVVNRNNTVVNSDLIDLEEAVIDWNESSVDLAALSNDCSSQLLQLPSYISSSSDHQSIIFGGQNFREHQRFHASSTSIPITPTENIRLLVQRPRIGPGTHKIAGLIFQNLKSYPLAMLRHNTLPPFIHPHMTASEVLIPYMEPLTNCFSLIHMMSYNVQGNKKLFWKNVRLECERFHAKRADMNEWELLAALQALSLYVLIRLLEGETDHNDLDFLLLMTVTVIAKQLNDIDTSRDLNPANGTYVHTTSWENWILEESIRRLCVIYQIVNMIVYFDPAAMCTLQTDLVLAPLPAHKCIWGASNESSWKIESDKHSGIQSTFGLASNGELVKLDGNHLSRSGAVLSYEFLQSQGVPSSSDNWAEWCSGMDELGGLVMLAASLT